jgi:hypothetical protein
VDKASILHLKSLMKSIHRTIATFAVLSVFSASTGPLVLAQTAQDAPRTLGTAVTPGMDVWITDSSGREEKSRIVGVSGGIVTSTAGGDVRRFNASDVRRIRARQSDSVMNGALIGAGAAVASALFLCTRMEPWENCRDDVGPLLLIGGIGAGVGIGIDALIRGRKTIYEAPEGSAELHAVPIIGRRAGGMRLSLAF